MSLEDVAPSSPCCWPRWLYARLKGFVMGDLATSTSLFLCMTCDVTLSRVNC